MQNYMTGGRLANAGGATIVVDRNVPLWRDHRVACHGELPVPVHGPQSGRAPRVAALDAGRAAHDESSALMRNE